MDADDMSPDEWTYEKAGQIPGNDEVTLYFHQRRDFSRQTKVTLTDPRAAIAWAADRGFPDPGPALGIGA